MNNGIESKFSVDTPKGYGAMKLILICALLCCVQVAFAGECDYLYDQYVYEQGRYRLTNTFILEGYENIDALKRKYQSGQIDWAHFQNMLIMTVDDMQRHEEKIDLIVKEVLRLRSQLQPCIEGGDS